MAFHCTRDGHCAMPARMSSAVAGSALHPQCCGPTIEHSPAHFHAPVLHAPMRASRTTATSAVFAAILRDAPSALLWMRSVGFTSIRPIRLVRRIDPPGTRHIHALAPAHTEHLEHRGAGRATPAKGNSTEPSRPHVADLYQRARLLRQREFSQMTPPRSPKH
jgi:hypothetical protein